MSSILSRLSTAAFSLSFLASSYASFTNSSTKVPSPLDRVSQKLKGSVVDWRLCNDPRLQAEDNQFICYIIGGDKLVAVNVAFDQESLTGKLRAVDPFNMSQAVGNAITEMTGDAIRTSNRVLPAPLPGNRYSTLNWTYADTAIYLEGFPCTGTTTVGPGIPDLMQQFRYGDVALALGGYLSVALHKRPPEDNVALVLAWEMRASEGLKTLEWDWFGWFTVQNVQAPYVKFSDFVSNVFACDPKLRNADTASIVE